MSVKGGWQRPCSVGPEELKLRHDRMNGRISDAEFDRGYRKLLKAGKITRNGRVIRDS